MDIYTCTKITASNETQSTRHSVINISAFISFLPRQEKLVPLGYLHTCALISSLQYYESSNAEELRNYCEEYSIQNVEAVLLVNPEDG